MIALLALACTSERPAPGDSMPTDTWTTTPTFPVDTGPLPLPTGDTGPPDPGTPFYAITAAPLAAYGSVVRVTWAQNVEAPVHLEYSFEDGVWLQSPVRELGVGPHEELLLGVPYETAVDYRLATDKEMVSLERQVQTGALSPRVPLAQVTTYDPEGVDPDVPYILVGVSEDGSLRRTWVTLIDRQGRVLWAHRTPVQRNSMQPRISRGGDSFLIDHSSYFANLQSGGADSQIVELKIDGSVVRRWDVPGQHHPYVDLPDGSIAYGRYVGGFGVDDRIEIASPSGALRTLFSCRQFIQEHDMPQFDCGSNTVSYDEVRGTFLFSMFTLDSVFEINATTGAVERLFGALAQNPWPSATDLPGWSFDPPSSAFDYQHNPHYTASGTLLVSTHVNEEDTELVAREYEVDESTHTLRQVWSFGVGRGVDGCQMGEAHRLPNGNTLHNHGTYARLREATPERGVVWDIAWEDEEYSCYGGQNTPGHQVLRSNPVGPDLYRFAPPRR